MATRWCWIPANRFGWSVCKPPNCHLGEKGFVPGLLATGPDKHSKTLPSAVTYGGREIDRYGRLLAHLHDPSGTWIQGEMLRKGMARVYSFPDNRALVGKMLALENEARLAQRGIWRHRFYHIRTADTVKRHINSFQLIEGRVWKVAVRRKRTYINFEEDWRTDFTISVKRRNARNFKTAPYSLPSLVGKRIRIRGWVKNWNGPFIEATHPE